MVKYIQERYELVHLHVDNIIHVQENTHTIEQCRHEWYVDKFAFKKTKMEKHISASELI